MLKNRYFGGRCTKNIEKIHIFFIFDTVQPVLRGHSKIDITKVLMANGSLKKVQVFQIAPLGAFYNTLDLQIEIIGCENHFFFLSFLSGRLRLVLLTYI